MTIVITLKNAALSGMTFGILCHYAEYGTFCCDKCYYAEYITFLLVMLSVILLSITFVLLYRVSLGWVSLC